MKGNTSGNELFHEATDVGRVGHKWLIVNILSLYLTPAQVDGTNLLLPKLLKEDRIFNGGWLVFDMPYIVQQNSDNDANEHDEKLFEGEHTF